MRRLFWTFPARSLVSLRLGFYYWFIFPAVGYCLLYRRKDLWAPLLWWFLVAVLLNLSTIGGARLPFYSRQLYPIIVPGVILLAAALLHLRAWPALGSPGIRKTVRVLLPLLAVFSLAGGAALWAFQNDLLPVLARFYTSKHVFVPEEMVEWLLEFFFRYMIVTAFLFACLFVALGFTARRRERAGSETWAGTVLVATLFGFLAISSVSFAFLANRGVPNAKIEKVAYEILRDLPPKPIYADWYTKKMLDFHFDFQDPDRVVDFRDVRLEDVRDGYLVYNTFRKDMELKLRSVAAQYKGGDFYLYPYDSVDEAMGENWEVIESARGGLIIIYRIHPVEE